MHFSCFLVFVHIVAKHEQGGRAAAGFREVQVVVIDIRNEDHVTGMVSYETIKVCRKVVGEHSVSGVVVFGRGGFFK